jgi:hypothetical protein
VIILDEAPDDIRATRQHARIRLFLSFEPAQGIFIEQQHSIQQPVLAHQVFGG